MRFPNYESYEPVHHRPFDGYLTYIGRRNSSDPYITYEPRTKQHAAALFAKGCTELALEGNHRQAKKLF